MVVRMCCKFLRQYIPKPADHLSSRIEEPPTLQGLQGVDGEECPVYQVRALLHFNLGVDDLTKALDCLSICRLSVPFPYWYCAARTHGYACCQNLLADYHLLLHKCGFPWLQVSRWSLIRPYIPWLRLLGFCPVLWRTPTSVSAVSCMTNNLPLVRPTYL